MRLLLALLSALVSHEQTVRAAESNTNSSGRSCCARIEAPAAFTGKSLYQTESEWTADDGRRIKLGGLAGRPQVVVMFFAHCQSACPIIVNDLRRIEAALPPDQRARVGFTLVSFDPKRDTPAALAEYRKIRGLPADRWTFLCGRADDVLELAALLGVRYQEDANGQFLHSNVITLLNSNGEIVSQQTGLNSNPHAMIRQIEQLVKP
jgi:protein SCO1